MSRVTISDGAKAVLALAEEKAKLQALALKLNAHLYTTLELAEKKAAQYRKGKQWWKNVEVIPVEVVWRT